MFKLRTDQLAVKQGVYSGWQSGLKNMLAVMPTGGGKTVVFSDIIREHVGFSCAIAHRQELVSQISMAMARNDVRHRVIAQPATIRDITKMHRDEFGKSWVDPNAGASVAGVDTLLRRADKYQSFMARVSLCVIDEAHHVLKDNKWGKAMALFPSAKGLGVTATPIRADGMGLGSHADGIYDDMVIGASMREMIQAGSLTDYRVFCPPSDVNFSQVKISETTGDYNQQQLATATKGSHIVGDVVSHYLKHASGKLGVTFAVDVEHAQEIADNFNAVGVPALAVSAKTPTLERASAIRKFRNREILQLVNCDLFGEGFDLPAVEVVSMARKTESYSLYSQQFGRALRRDPSNPGKVAVIIDHVGNVHRHGLPDSPRVWTLDRRDKKARREEDADIPPTTDCVNPECGAVYLATKPACPYCSEKPEPIGRDRPEQVEGDLIELTGPALDELRRAIDDANVSPLYMEQKTAMVAGGLAGAGARKRQRERIEALASLDAEIKQWAGYMRHFGKPDSESFRTFYKRFGVDCMSALALKKAEAESLQQRIKDINEKYKTGEIDAWI